MPAKWKEKRNQMTNKNTIQDEGTEFSKDPVLKYLGNFVSQCLFWSAIIAMANYFISEPIWFGIAPFAAIYTLCANLKDHTMPPHNK